MNVIQKLNLIYGERAVSNAPMKEGPRKRATLIVEQGSRRNRQAVPANAAGDGHGCGRSQYA